MTAPAPRCSESDRLLAELPVGVMHTTGEIIDFVNPALARILGEAAERLIGRSYLEFIAPADAGVVEGRYWTRQRGGEGLPRVYELMARVQGGAGLRRVEIEPRVVGPRQMLVLVRDMSDRLRDSALLAALSEVALQTQRARGVRGVVAAACDGLRQFGLQALAARVQGGSIIIEHLALRESAELALSRRFGASMQGTGIELSKVPEVGQAIGERRVVSHDSVARQLVRILRAGAPKVRVAGLAAELAAAGFCQGVVCPINVRGESWGLLIVVAETLGSADAAALGLFASKVGSAIENAQTIEDLESKNRELASIEAVANAGSEPEFGRLLVELLRIVAAATGSDSASLHVFDAEKSELRLAGSHGDLGLVLAKHERIPLEERGPSSAFQLLCTRAVSISRDIPPHLRREFVAEGTQEVATAPLHIKGRLAGMLSLGRTSARPYTREELGFADRLSAQIAIQVENARLYADVRRRVRLLSVLFDLSRIGEVVEVAPMVDQALEKVLEAVPADFAGIHFVQGDELVLAGRRGESSIMEEPVRFKLECGYLCCVAARERRTASADLKHWPSQGAEIAAFHGVAHGLSVPLLAGERLIGTFSLMRRADHAFDEEEVRLLESSATQAAMAIEHARLFEQERGRVEDLKLFLEASRVITASLDLDQILEASAANIARATQASHAFILLREPGSRVLRGVATSDAEHREHFRTVRLLLDDPSVAALAVDSRSPVRVADAIGALGDPHWLLDRYGHKSLLALPLLLRGDPIGVVMVTDNDRAREWSDAQLERATVVASQVAVAVANARLYEDLRTSYEALARTQAELVGRERLAALGELSAVVAHEVRNPLGVIFNSLGSLRRVLKPSGDAAMLLDIVGEEADRLNRIVGDLLDFARPNEPAIQPEPLAALLTGAAESARALAAGNGVVIEVLAGEPLPAPPIDARMMRQALVNLAFNAVQAMPRGGRLTLRADEERSGGRRMVRIEVRDTGAGVPAELAERIFQPFFTTKASGTGLGLAVVRRIVDAHRGELALESAPGEGARFVIRLPLESSD